MSNNIRLSFQPKKPFHHRNGSDELDVFEASGYFSGATDVFSGTQKNIVNNMQKYGIRPIARMSLDMPTHRGNSIPLKAMIENPIMINKEKKFKQPSSPGGKLAHFLNSLFNQTSSKKSKSKSKSTKDEDETPGGWRRRRRSSISHFRSENSNSSSSTTTTTSTITATSTAATTATIMSDSRTPPRYHIAHTPTNTITYKDPRNYSFLKPPPTQIKKIPINGNLIKIENVNKKGDLIEKKISFGNGFMHKVNTFDKKPEVLREDDKEFKKFTDDDGGDSDSSSDLFELTNCDLGYCSSGLPVYETTRVNSIKNCANIELSV